MFIDNDQQILKRIMKVRENVNVELHQSNKKYFETLFYTYYQDLCNFAFSFLRDQMLAEDIVQSFFKELWEKRKTINIQSNIRAYLFQAIKNDCLDYLKSKFAQTTFESINSRIEIEADEIDITYHGQDDLLELVKIAIQKLPTQCQTIFSLSRIAGMSHKEIASELNLSPKTVENQIGIALKKIREYIKEQKD